MQGEAYPAAKPYPLDVLGAETEGMIAYLIDQELVNRLKAHRQVATLLTQVIVDEGDPAFKRPEKFVGPVYQDAMAHKLAAERGWTVAQNGRAWRRVVPSPEPLADVHPDELAELSFAAGSMGPNVDAACRFAERTGGLAGIGALADAAAILRGERGTRVRARVEVGT